MNTSPTKTSLLLITGSGPKAGKTLFVESLLKQWGSQMQIHALKISDHVPDEEEGQRVILQGEGFRLYREFQPGPNDNGRYLKAGAISSCYLEADEAGIISGFNAYLEMVPREGAIVCESNGLSGVIEPDLVIFMNDADVELNENDGVAAGLSDVIISNPGEIQTVVENLRFDQGSWKLIPSKV